ncbi:T9SS type B sorting domain-containing protein [Aggregatimonas sangjinii]|uniref:T9SS type B sorting domain-containing protein n=1 Tax=Aggregatimonas sangjinii TaxID=2583587 RepID=A0A5B7SUP5_9FLAO|nr:T9SS type B sorting domain-containing protein [Aggregatimonas sangjinii]QCX01892.1 T9SS type B sorting domain-containing protein [Aggregatimonas sangjinii]
MSYRIAIQKKYLVFFALIIGCFFISDIQAQQAFGPRLQNANDPSLDYINIKGDYTFLANSVMNRVEDFPAPGTTIVNIPYNGTFGNNSWIRDYVNVDPGPGIFNSSSSTLATPDCSRIYWAGLYWAGNYDVEWNTPSSYPYSYDTSRYPDDNTHNDVTSIKFKVPGGTYVDITADNAADPVGEEDHIIIDGYADGVPDSPYVCYKNVTGMLQALADPDGEYFAANIRGTRGGNTYGVAGWTLVVIYENPTLTGKYISVFDGYEGVTTQTTASSRSNIDIAGFNTVPAGPVRARIGVSVLEGETDLTGDRFRIRTPLNPTYSNLSNGANPANNFFNSSITIDGANVNSRNINSTNSMGYDSDIFNISNPGNSVIENGETSARLQLRTSSDWFGAFLVTFGVDIIEPDIVLEKKVEDIAGNDITGQGVNLGQILDYVLSFTNTGNDDATNYTIRDVLPINTTLDESNITMPPGTTYTYNPATREVVFSIPDNIIEIGDPISQIRMRVQVAENCFDFIDACTDLIQNLAYSTYEGVINDNQITDDPSVSDFDDCGFVTPGATNFLLDDLSDCNFTRTVQLCGDFAILDAGDNFDSYVWVRDDNNNGELDATDTVQNDGDPDGDPSTLVVTQTGTYIVDKIVADPCKGFKEIIMVERFGSTQTNPLVDFFNNSNNDADATNDVQGEIAQCSVDGDLLPKIFLCGAGDTQLIQVNIPDAQSLSWELLDEASCPAANADCANKNLTCTYNQVGTGGDFTANAPGKYRLVINYANGCFSRFYFDVFQNNLDVQYNKRDIFCATDGNITITNLGANYGYRLLDVAAGTILIPFSANNGPSFDITTNGAYRVDVVQLDGAGDPIPGACIFSTPNIGVLDRDFQVDVETTPANCNAQGTIKIDILNVRPDYTYVLRLADGTLVDDETAQPDNTHTFNVNPGDYIVEASTSDGCTFSQNVTVAATPDPTVLAVTTRNIGCSAGMITLTGSNGFPDPEYSYAIWSKDGTPFYTDFGAIPGDAYQTDPVFNFGWSDTDDDGIDELYTPGEDGDYVFVIVDSNNCFALSNEVTITDNGAMTVSVTDDSGVSCSGNNDAQITIVPSGGIGPYTYSIDAGTTTQPSPTYVNLSAGTYNIQVTDSSGCTINITHDIVEPFPLSASAGVSRDATCDPMGAEVRITNVVGGTAPYAYSFDGGSTYGTSTIEVLPAGTYTIIVRDASTCTFPMTVTVEDVPPPPLVTLTPEVSYLCDGSATVTATPNITTYNYTYSLDGAINSPPDSNVFTNVAPGTYTVSTNYVSQTPPTPSLLLSEDFGNGLTIPNPNTSGYFYENQLDDTTPSGAPIDNSRSINDYEYAVTSHIERPFGAWMRPVDDHTSNGTIADGRYLVINIGAPSPGQIIYQKPINDIIPNQPIDVSLWLINLIRSTRTLVAPDLTIELRDTTTDAVVATANTGAVPNNEDWNEYVLSLNPGANTSLNLVITTNESEINGNDVAIDDITVYQTPEVCELTVQTSVVVEAGRVFASNIVGSTNVSCNGLSDGTISFEAENFDATAGFDYSLDGGTTWINSTTSPVTTGAIYGAGLQRIELRKADETSCTTFVEATISEPAILAANAAITTPLNCTNGGATITASVSGGTPGYTYQLEDTAGVAVASYDFATNGSNTVFTGIAPGDYIVRVRDNNSCEDPIDSSLTVVSTETIAFDITATNCYSGANDATIEVDVTDGNGNYTFSINGGPWVTPTPSSATSYIFTNLADGSYTINVRDGAGCIGVAQIAEIDPPITVSATAPNITACATSTFITISSSGGDGSFQFAVMPDGATPSMPDYNASTVREVFAPGDYDIYLRDPSGGPNRCTAFTEITIFQDDPIAITPTPSDVSCFGASNGAISIVVNSGGEAPFTYSIDNGATYVIGSNFPNLAAGTYPVRVRDANGCETIVQNVPVSQPALLEAEAVQTQDYTCTQSGQITVGSVTPTSGGSGSYQYSINGGTWTAATTGGHTFVDLIDGTYSIRVRDANVTSCGITLGDIVILPLPVEPVLTTSISYNCDGTGEITVNPFDASYTYILDGVLPGQTGAGANILSDVAIGNHVITVDYGSDCTRDIPIIVESGNAFGATITAFENLDCNADNSGTITISADNFGTGGYEYSLDATTFVGPFTAPEQLTGLAAQAYTITVRDVNDPIAGCTVTLNQTLTEPTAIVAAASITEAFTCDNTGATITASASNGTPTYEYQLEDGVGGILTAYQGTTTFTNVPAGDYIVRARDTNGCTDAIDTPITITAPVSPAFTTTPTACYSGANDASIQVDIDAGSLPGNGGFQFSLDGGPWMTPTPATGTTYTFDRLANGTYTVDVRDAFGCTASQQTITINPQLNAIVDVIDISSCADGSITVTPSGGDGNYAYAFVSTGTSVTTVDFGPANTFTVTAGNDGAYDAYVWDNNANALSHCEFMDTVTVNPATPLTFSSAPTNPICYNGVGSIEVSITSGDNPYTIQIIDLDNGGASNQTDSNVIASTQTYYNLAPGNYTINVTDANGCTVTDTPVTINNPDELTGDVRGVTPASCTGDPNDFGFEFISYTTTLGTIEFSADGGATWTGDNSVPGTTDRFTGYTSGDTVYPSMRTVSGGVTVCQTDLPPFIIPFPLDDLDITVSAVVVNCNELQVTVLGGEGTPNYQYTYSEDPANFDSLTPVHPWEPNPATDNATPYTFTGLVPGRTYVFYVRDAAGCVRQSNVNVNDLITVPLAITTASEPSCAGASDGEITFTVTDNTAPFGSEFRWTVYDVSGGTPVAVANSGGGGTAINQPFTSPQDVTVNGLPTGNYFIDVIEVDGGVDSCRGASENLFLDELDPITATLNKLSDISCANPGLIAIENIQGGGGTFTYTVTGPAPFSTITGTPDNPVSIPANSPAGNYNITITDQFGCFADLGPINVGLTANPTIDSIVVDNCVSPTSLTINASSTAAQILYSIDGGATYVDNGGVFNNLTTGNYTVSIIDSNGCTDTDTVDIHPILEANVSLTKLLDCTASPDAEITIEVTFGSGDYDYQITDGTGTVVAKQALPSNPYVFSATIAEDYVITVYDNLTAGPCNRIFNITVPDAVTPAFTEVHTDLSCNGANDGSITLTETLNGINPLTYTISPAAGSFNAATNTFENLPPNTYTVTGRGTNNCPFDIVGIVIDEPFIISVPAAAVVEFGCTAGNNPNDASISINNAGITGGSGTFVRYEFINDQGTATTGDDVVVQTGSSTIYTETNTAGGTYIINVYDDNGCLGSTNATILPYVEINNATVIIDQGVSCTPGNDAQVTIGYTATPATPVPTITYSVTGTDNAYSSLNQATAVFTGLGVGNYEVTVTNTDTSCFIQTAFEIEDPNTFEIDTTVTDVICFGDNGSVSFTINDPINPYAAGFLWQIYDSQGTADLLDDVIIAAANGISANVGPTAPFAIGAGEYRVEITQDSDPSCVNNALFTIAGPSAAITANTDVTPITCVGNDGTIEIIDVLGGWGTYQYYVGTVAPTVAGDYSATLRFENLAPGTYEAWVIDSEGCQTQVDNGILLANPTPISADLQINQPNCTDLNGEIEVINEANGQGSNYRYQLQVFNTINGTFEDLRPIQTSDVFSGLGAGQYQVVVSDQWTCTFVTAAVTLYAPIAPLTTVVKSLDCSASPGGEITVTQTGGSGSFDYEVRYPGTLAADPADDANTTGVFTGLTLVGDYVFTITDQDATQACPTNITQNLEPAVYPVLTIDSATDVSCNGANDGTIAVSVPDNGVGPYTFEIVSGDGSSVGSPILPTSSTATTATFSGLTGAATPGITYTVRATGTNSCFVEQTQAIVMPDAIANVAATVIDFACTAGNNGNNATITIDAGITGGSGSYVRYEFINTDTATTVQDGPNASYTETDFAGGNYSINVYDSMGCVGNTTAYIAPFDVLQSASVAIIDQISCVNAGEDIRIDVVGSLSDSTGSPANYEYRLLPGGTFQSSNVFNDLATGSHAFEIRNVNTGCLISVTHFIADPNTFDITVNKLSDVQCFGGTGEIQLEISDATYTGGFVWMIFDANGTPADRSDDGPFILDGTWPDVGPTGTIAVPAGTFVVEIRQNGYPECTQTEVFTITTPSAALIAAVTEESSPSCTDDQGRILVNPSGGQGPYTILLEDTAAGYSQTQTNVSAYIFTGLAGGDYDVTVTDALGCIATGARTLITPDALTATIANTNLACFNDNTASVTATVAARNVTPAYLYRLNTYSDAAGTNLLSTSATQTADNFQNLPAGFYSISVSDDVGCTTETTIVQIANPVEVVATLLRTSPLTCATGVEFQLSATGGSGTYAYSEDNITFIPMVGNTVNLPQSGVLAAGTYRYYVRDEASGCTAVLSNEISEDPIDPVVLEIDASAAVINCNGENTAIIYASATGGLGNYEYALFTDAALTNNYYSPGNFQTSGQFSDLPAGTYYVRVSSNDCPPDSREVIINEPAILVVDDANDFTNPSCFGDENGSIRVSLSGGAGGYQYAISPRLDQFFPIGEFNDLAPGDYTVIAQDENGCFVELSYTITAPELLEATGTPTPEICIGEENGTISLTVTGGTAPYRTALNSNSEADFVQDRMDFTDLASGDYVIIVRDANDCETDLIVSVTPGVNLNAVVEPVYECSGDSPDNYINIILEDSSVLGDVLYAVDSTDPADMQLNPDFRNIAPGTHFIAIAHANGCVQTFDFEIADFEPLTLLLQNNELNLITAVAGGGREGYTFFFNDIDNGNDNTYRINQSGTYTVRVVDENGCEVVQSIPMEFIDIEIPEFFTPGGDGLNETWQPRNQEAFPEILTIVFDRYGREIYRMGLNDAGWDGFYNTKALPSGDYWYVIKLRGENDPREFVGHFTLYR